MSCVFEKLAAFSISSVSIDDYLDMPDASKERPIWLALFKWYSASVEHRPLWPQKPLDMYNARELEGTILRWKSIKAGWARNDSWSLINGISSFHEGSLIARIFLKMVVGFLLELRLVQ